MILNLYERLSLNEVLALCIRLARGHFRPAASSTFISKQTSHQQPASSNFLSEQISTSHQPNEQVVQVVEINKFNGPFGLESTTYAH
jgi:hypothetical protein